MSDLLARAREHVEGSYPHNHALIEELIDELEAKRHANGSWDCAQMDVEFRVRGDLFRGAVAALREQNQELRAALEWVCPASEGFTEAFDGLVARGLLVEVPADETYRAEWGTDTMYVWSWRALLDQGQDDA